MRLDLTRWLDSFSHNYRGKADEGGYYKTKQTLITITHNHATIGRSKYGEWLMKYAY